MDKEFETQEASAACVETSGKLQMEVSPEQYQALQMILKGLGQAAPVAKNIPKVAEGANSKSRDYTVNELFEITKNKYWSLAQFSDSDWGKQAEGFYKKHIKPTFGQKRISEIDQGAIREWRDGMEKTPVAANRAMAVFKKIINYGMSYGYLAHITRNPFYQVEKLPEESRERFATVEEIPRIAKAMQSLEDKHPAQITFFFVLMFTGSRPSFLLRLKWSDIEKGVDKDGREVGIVGYTTRVKGKKNYNKLVIPHFAMARMKQLPKESDNEKIFKFKEVPRRIWKRILKEAEIEGLYARDFRRSFATIALSNGVALSQLSELLNHKDPKTTKIYAKLNSGKRVDASAEMGDKIEELINM